MILTTIKRLLFVVVKNLRVVFRSWRSFMLLIIGPLLLILLVGFAFSGSKAHDIKIGIYAKDYEAIGPVTDGLKEFGDIIRFDNYQTCIKELKKGEVSICTHFSEDFTASTGGEGIPSGTITLYYDNSRMIISETIVNYLKYRVGVTSEQISLEVTKKILGDIEGTVNFLIESKSSLNQFMTELDAMKGELSQLRLQLGQIKKGFDPVHKSLKDMQKELNSDSNRITQSKELINNQIDDLYNSLGTTINNLESTKSQITVQGNRVSYTKTQLLEQKSQNDQFIANYGSGLPIEMINSIQRLSLDQTANSLEPQTYTSTSNQITILNMQIQSMRNNLQSYKSDVNGLYSNIPGLILQFNQMMTELGKIESFLNLAIAKSDESVVKLEESTSRMREMQKTLETNIDKFTGLSEEQAAALVSPIQTIHKPLFVDIENVFLLFPMILPVIIIFISILLSNIVVLEELYSTAQIRNFIMPVKDLTITLGFFVTNMMIILFQVMILLMVAQFQLRIDVFSHFLPLLLIISLLVTIFILVGTIIAHISRTKESSILISTFLSVGLFLFSDIILPTEMMPKAAATLAQLNPIVLAESLFRKKLFFNIPLIESFNEITVMLIYIGVLFIILNFALVYHRKKFK